MCFFERLNSDCLARRRVASYLNGLQKKITGKLEHFASALFNSKKRILYDINQIYTK